MRDLVPEDRFRNGRGAREQAMATLTRSVITAAHGRFNPSTTSEALIRKRGWGDAEKIAHVLRAAANPATTSGTGWAKELSPIGQAFLANLVPTSAGADLLSRGLSLSLDGLGSINIPNVSTPLADFCGQGAPIPVISGTSGNQATLTPCKFAAIITLTRELTESSNGEALVRQALLDAMGPSLDRRLFDNVAATPDSRPAGLLVGKTPLTASTDADKIAAMVADLSALAGTVAPLAGNGGIVFVAAAKQAVAINIGLLNFPYPLLSSTSLSAGTIICVAPVAIVSVIGDAPQIDITKAATLHMSDAPLAIASGGTEPSPMMATFQADVIGLRLRWPVAWAIRNSGAIAHMISVAW